MKPGATKAAILLRIKLRALAARGIEGEATAAAAKLTRLEARYDFSAPAIPEQQAGDIFAGISIPYDDEARNVATLGAQECDVAPFVAWALGSGCRIETTLRSGRDWQTHVAAHVPLGSLAHVGRLAEHIATGFRGAWSCVLASSAVRAQDRTLFLRGLLDGMTGDERQSGERLRNASTPTKAPKGKRRTIVASGIAVHPYTLALDLGRRIRLSAPAEEIATVIEEATRGQIAA